MINETIQTTTEIAKANMYNTSLWILWASFLIVFALLGMSFKSKGSKWGNFWVVYFLSAVVTAGILIFLTTAPEQASTLLDSIKSWVNGA